MNLIVSKLKKLKEVVVAWKKEKRKNMQVEYSDLEHKLIEVVQIFPSQIFPSDVKEEIMTLEKKI